MKRTVLLAGVSLLAMTAHANALEALGSIIISSFLAVGAGSLLPTASAAAIGLSALTAAGTVANLALSFLGRQKANPQALKNTSKGTEGPGRYAFGRVELKGKIGFGNTAGYSIYRLILHAFGKLSAIEEWFYDGRAITVEEDGAVSSPPWATPSGSYLKLKNKIGDGSEIAWAELTADFPTLWTADHRVRGICQTLLKATNPGTGNAKFQRLYQGGIKEVGIRARMGEFYDPRDASTGWTINGVLHCLHWFRRLPGMTDAMIAFDAIGAVAGQAEASVATLSGTAPRCQLSGGWEGPLTTDIVLDMLESAGLDVRSTDDGTFTFEFIEDDPAPEITFLNRHIIDRFPQVGPESGRRPNVCRLSYFSPERRYEMAEIDLTGATWARIESEISKYGEQEMPIELPFGCDASQAQRIGRRLFHMARAEFGTMRTTLAGIAAWGMRTALVEVPDVGDDGASVFLKVRLGTVRVNDEEGTCDIPFQVIPEILKTPWNPAVDEVAPPPVLEALQYESELDTPAAPAEAALVEYPDNSREVRLRIAPVTGATIAEASRRSYAGALPNAWGSMTEIGLTLAYRTEDLEGDKVDFRVRYFDADENGSYFSPLLAVAALAIDNTATAAPTQTIDPSWTFGNVPLTVTAPDVLRVAWIKVEKKVGPAAWTTHHTANVRPGEVVTVPPVTDVPTALQTLQIRSYAYTSDDTQSPASTLFSETVPA